MDKVIKTVAGIEFIARVRTKTVGGVEAVSAKDLHNLKGHCFLAQILVGGTKIFFSIFFTRMYEPGRNSFKL